MGKADPEPGRGRLARAVRSPGLRHSHARKTKFRPDQPSFRFALRLAQPRGAAFLSSPLRCLSGRDEFTNSALTQMVPVHGTLFLQIQVCVNLPCPEEASSDSSFTRPF